MKTTLKIALPLIAVAVAVAMPAAVGLLARPTFDTLVRTIEQRHGRIGNVAERTTRHGWFQTTRRVSVAVSDPAARTLLAGFLDGANLAAPLLLNLDIALRHGPLPLAAGIDGMLSPALGNTLLTWQVQQGDSHARLPLSVLVRSGPRRSSWTVQVAPQDYPSAATEVAQLRHSGARLDGSLTNDGARLEGSGSLGNWFVASPDGRRFAALGGQLDFALARESAANGYGALRFDTLRIATVAAASPMTIKDVALTAEMDVAGQRLNSTSRIRLGETRLDDTQLSSGAYATLDVRADALAAAAVARFFAVLAAGGAADEGPPLVGVLAAKGVTLAVPELQVDTPDGALVARMEGELPAGDGDARNMLLRSAGTAEMSIPVKLLRRIMASSPDIEATLQYALQSGLVRRQGRAYVSNWRLRGGSLRINDRTVPLPL